MEFDAQRIRDWWLKFAPKHKLIAQFIRFCAFSMLVTVFQYLMLTSLPDVFYRFTGWCDIPCQLVHLALEPVGTYVFNYPITGDATGGMEHFTAFAITLFLAQCINFPIQRSIMFRSRGNVHHQMAWYTVTFMLITMAYSLLMGLYVPFCRRCFSPAVYNILITVINDGVQMAIYFPVYRIIFPESETRSGR